MFHWGCLYFLAFWVFTINLKGDTFLHSQESHGCYKEVVFSSTLLCLISIFKLALFHNWFCLTLLERILHESRAIYLNYQRQIKIQYIWKTILFVCYWMGVGFVFKHVAAKVFRKHMFSVPYLISFIIIFDVWNKKKKW